MQPQEAGGAVVGRPCAGGATAGSWQPPGAAPAGSCARQVARPPTSCCPTIQLCIAVQGSADTPQQAAGSQAGGGPAPSIKQRTRLHVCLLVTGATLRRPATMGAVLRTGIEVARSPSDPNSRLPLKLTPPNDLRLPTWLEWDVPSAAAMAREGRGWPQRQAGEVIAAARWAAPLRRKWPCCCQQQPAAGWPCCRRRTALPGSISQAAAQARLVGPAPTLVLHRRRVF